MARFPSAQSVTASNILCTEEGVAMQMWNDVLHVTFKTVITIRLLGCFVALEASVILVKTGHFMVCMFNI